MKTLKTMILTGLVALAFAAIQPAKADLATGNSTATIVPTLSMSQAAGNFLNFGRIAQSPTGGQLTINPDGARTVSGLQIISASAHTQAIFNVTGDPGASFSIILPTSAIMTRAAGTETMTVNNFTCSLGTSGIGFLEMVAGTGVVNVGATLNVAPNQAGGEYDGTFNVTYAYN